MGKLTDLQIEEYFDTHLPYRNGILLVHMKLCAPGPWHGDKHLLNASFEASLVTGRMFLNVLGVGKNSRDELEPYRFRKDDVSAEDLKGKLIDVQNLPHGEGDLFVGFLKMADKGAAHLTLPMKHPWDKTHEAILRIQHYVRTNLYQATGRSW